MCSTILRSSSIVYSLTSLMTRRWRLRHINKGRDRIGVLSQSHLTLNIYNRPESKASHRITSEAGASAKVRQPELRIEVIIEIISGNSWFQTLEPVRDDLRHRDPLWRSEAGSSPHKRAFTEVRENDLQW